MKKLKLDESDLKRIFIPDTPLANFWRKLKRFLKQLLALGTLYVIFFILLNFGAYWARFQYTVNASPEPIVIINEKPQPTISYKPRLQIPKLRIDAPLIFDIDASYIVDQLRNGVVQYADTANPGEIGNMVIVGHSSDFPWSNGKYKNVFALLDKLKVGDKIVLPYGSEKYVYSVTGSKIVGPTELSVLRRTNSPTLTLLTCYPVGTSRNRLIITARLVSDNVSGQQRSDPLSGESLPRPR